MFDHSIGSFHILCLIATSIVMQGTEHFICLGSIETTEASANYWASHDMKIGLRGDSGRDSGDQ